MTLLEGVQLANSGKLLWDAFGPLLQESMEQNLPTVSIDDLKAKSASLGKHIDELDLEIALKEIRDAQR